MVRVRIAHRGPQFAMRLVTTAHMQELDRRTIEEEGVPGLTLMERAGSGVVRAMERRLGLVKGKTVTILCGKGNNGGDGFVVGRLLIRKGARTRVALMARPADLRGDAKTNHVRFLKAAGKTGVVVLPDQEALGRLLEESDVVVDALLGTGLSAPVKDPYREAIRAVNRCGRPVFAADLPSGLHGDTGDVLGEAVRATMTVTFGLPKIGLYLGRGIDLAGAIEIVDIGIPDRFVQRIPGQLSLMTLLDAKRSVPERLPSSHKGTFGHAGIIAGSVGKTGAAALAARAALRTGAGLVTVATPVGVNHVLESKLLEAMTVPMPETAEHTLAQSALDDLLAFVNVRTAAAIGPGLGTQGETVRLVRELIPRLAKPCVVDADALNALASQVAVLNQAKAPLILTPHPGEMARLVDGTTSSTINHDRIGHAARFAGDRHVVVVLKGARTVVAHPDGRVAVCPTGNPGMATAGCGDVLTGMVVGFLAQGSAAWEAACAATYFHGLAGDLAAAAVGRTGMIAGDLLDQIPHALAQAE